MATTGGLVRIAWLARPGALGANQINAASESPSHARASSVGDPSWRHSIVISGYAAMNRETNSPAIIGGVMLMNPAWSRPSCTRAQERAVACTSSAAASVACDFSMKASPAGVTATPRGFRSSSLTPTCDSSHAIAWERAGCASWSLRAARVI